MTAGRTAFRFWVVSAVAFAALWCIMWIPAYAGIGGLLYFYPAFALVLLGVEALALVAVVYAVIALVRGPDRRPAVTALVFSLVLMAVAPPLFWFGAFVPLPIPA